MTKQTATVFSNQTGISTRVCPRGHVYLQVGHTCLTLRKSCGRQPNVCWWTNSLHHRRHGTNTNSDKLTIS